MTILSDGIKEMGLTCSDEQLRLLNLYISEIELWNPRYGLVNAQGGDLVLRHILDSLSGVGPISGKNVKTLADVGSGAGLPGIPLAIMFPQIHITLVERSGKRTRFLRNVAAVLNLKNISVLEIDLKDVTERFDLVTFRAFKPVEPGIIRLLMNILDDKGRLAAYKGKMENISEEIEQVKDIAVAEDVLPLSIPGLNEERHLVFYRKA